MNVKKSWYKWCGRMLRGNEQHESGVQIIVLGYGGRTVLGCHGRDQDVVEPRCSHTNAPIEMVESPTGPPSAAFSTVHAMLEL